MTEPESETGPSGELRWRTATEVVGVSFPDRTIELIVMPYETPTTVNDYGRGPVTEIINRGAFAGIERRANRVRVNRDHDRARTVGRAIAFHPARAEGLVAEIKIARTDLGDETLALADEECLDASAGFRPIQGGEHWETRTRVRVMKAWLGHIAMLPEPAYTGAKVLAVRSKPDEILAPERPNFVQLREQELERVYADLDARYARP